MKVAGFIYGLTNGPRGWSAFLHFYYKKIVAQTMALVCTTNVSMFFYIFNSLTTLMSESEDEDTSVAPCDNSVIKLEMAEISLDVFTYCC